MSLLLWIESFEWDRFNDLRPETLAELFAVEIECEREAASKAGGVGEVDAFPPDASELTSFLNSMVTDSDWYSHLDESRWPALDHLMWKAFSSRGFLGAELLTAPRTNGVLIETADASCPCLPGKSPPECYRMGHRRFRQQHQKVYPDETYDDPGYSIHCPVQVRRIHREILTFEYANYPDEPVSRNFVNNFLVPIQYCCDQGLAVICRWS